MLIVSICIPDEHNAQTARFVLQRAADYHGRLQELSQTSDQDDADECVQLEAEWTAMRIVLVHSLFLESVCLASC